MNRALNRPKSILLLTSLTKLKFRYSQNWSSDQLSLAILMLAKCERMFKKTNKFNTSDEAVMECFHSVEERGISFKKALQTAVSIANDDRFATVRNQKSCCLVP